MNKKVEWIQWTGLNSDEVDQFVWGTGYQSYNSKKYFINTLDGLLVVRQGDIIMCLPGELRTYEVHTSQDFQAKNPDCLVITKEIHDDEV